MTVDEISISFEDGTDVPVTLLPEQAPETCERVVAQLPIESELRHSRWCGREINTSLSIDSEIPRENQTAHTSRGDVVYWRDWVMPEGQTVEALAVYYGPEFTRGPQGPLRVNRFGRVPEEYWEDLTEVGERIWLGETEVVSLSV
jgi:hypothetical protein